MAQPWKRQTEFAVNSFTTFALLLQQDDLDREGDVAQILKDHKFHIYMICSRPRVALSPEQCEWKNHQATFVFHVQRGSTFEELKFGPIPFSAPSASLASEYPHTEVKITNSETGLAIDYKAWVLLSLVSPQAEADIPLRVLYVGQSYGDTGSRNAATRLRSHETLQKIYADAIRKNPDREIFLCLLELDHQTISAMDGQQPEDQYATTVEQDDAHIEAVLKTPISERQVINFTEGALIRYFQPPYNKNFRDLFPSPGHSSYAGCYELDMNGIIVGLDLTGTRLRFEGPDGSPRDQYLIQYNLHDAAERRSLLDEVFREPSSGP